MSAAAASTVPDFVLVANQRGRGYRVPMTGAKSL
jgi:hypothetical protein